MLSNVRKKSITENATQLLHELWEKKDTVVREGAGLGDLLPIPVGRIITRQLGLQFLEPQQIPRDNGEQSYLGSNFEIAGVMDRKAGVISVSKSFKSTHRQFTAAHEVGHWRLHKGMTYHREVPFRRDRSLSGPDDSPGRPIVEQEADWFAAQLTMPKKVLEKTYLQRFGKKITSQIDDDIAFWLGSSQSSRVVSPWHLRKLNSMQRAVLVADCTCFGGNFFYSLSEQFGVSPTAMAIQLVDSSLVS